MIIIKNYYILLPYYLLSMVIINIKYILYNYYLF